MNLTSKYGLKKPEGTDLVNIQDLNDNMDVIEEALVGKASSSHTHAEYAAASHGHDKLSMEDDDYSALLCPEYLQVYRIETDKLSTFNNSAIRLESTLRSELDETDSYLYPKYLQIQNGTLVSVDGDYCYEVLIDSGTIKITDIDDSTQPNTRLYHNSLVCSDDYRISAPKLTYNCTSPGVRYQFKDSFYCDMPASLGTSTYKWGQIYSNNSAISTSDRNAKKDIADLDDEVTRKFVMALKPSSYKFIVNESDRTHYGLISQDVEEIMTELGMDSKDFAGFIKSPKMLEQEEAVTDEKGRTRTITTQTIVEGEYDYALRYEEFIAPLIKMVQMQQQTITTLEERITELEAASKR